MFTGAHRPDAGPRPPRRNGPQGIPISLQTNALVNRDARYSYTDTPTELQRPKFQRSSSPANSMIDESPTRAPGDSFLHPKEQTQNGPLALKKMLVSNSKTPSDLEPPKELHPALYAPLAQPTKSSEEAQLTDVRQPAGPLPNKIDEQTTSPTYNSAYTQRATDPTRATSNVVHGHTFYNPDSLAGPNVALENHRPGQVSHPNAMVDPKWKHGLCEIDTLCCAGLFCPCVLYGKTQYRLSRRDQKQDPTDLLSYGPVNGSCGTMAAACGLQCRLFLVQIPGTMSKLSQGSWPQSNERDCAKCINYKGM